MATTTTDDGLRRTRDEIHDAFLAVLNACEPDHPYRTDPYPATHDDVIYGYKKRTGPYYASCGPRGGTKVAKFSADRHYLGSCSNERLLVVLVHEVTHITEGSHTDGSAHNPAFWREMAFHALVARDALDELRAVIGPIDKDEFLNKVPEDVNSSMTDRRMRTVEEQQAEVAELVGVTPPSERDG